MSAARRTAALSITAALACAVAFGVPAASPAPNESRPLAQSVRFLLARQLSGGGFAERGQRADPALTAWVVLGVRAAGATVTPAASDYLERSERDLRTATEIELVVLAQQALGRRSRALAARLRELERADGSIGPTLNSTIWGALAIRALGERVSPATVRYLLRRQSRSGGWGWAAGVAPDSNDTAAGVQALTAAGVRGPPIARALRFLRRLQNRDGGFPLVRGRASDAQSTAWAIQGFVAARARPGRAAVAYLGRLRRRDGSYRYSARYATTPVWVTAQVLPALARKPFPLR